jgi:hypothetical protein
MFEGKADVGPGGVEERRDGRGNGDVITRAMEALEERESGQDWGEAV